MDSNLKHHPFCKCHECLQHFLAPFRKILEDALTPSLRVVTAEVVNFEIADWLADRFESVKFNATTGEYSCYAGGQKAASFYCVKDGKIVCTPTEVRL